jgi:hypothetical protein
MSRVVSVDGTGMSLSQRFSALNKDKTRRNHVVNQQPVSAGINKRGAISPSTPRFLNQFQGNTRNQPTSPVRGGKRGVPLLGGSRNNFNNQDVRSPNNRGAVRGGRGGATRGVTTTRGAARGTVPTRGATTTRGGRGAARATTGATRGTTRGGRGATRGTTRGGRGARGGKGTRGGKGATSTLTAENLDKELAKYMLKDEKIGAQMLDSELDDYMAQRDAAKQEEKTD